jgi:type IV pilus assembly protein PilC
MRELAVFCRKLSFLLDAGVPVKSAVPIVAGQSPPRVYKKTLNDVYLAVMRGESLSNALKNTHTFPPFLYGLVHVGEMTAKLPKVMEQLADYYEQQAKVQDELKAAMMYPAVVTAMMLLVMGIAVTFVLPSYGRVFAASGVALPAITRVLMQISQFITGHPYIIMGFMAAAVTGFMLFFRSNPGRWLKDSVFLRVPLFRQNINLRFTQALSLLLSAGQPVTASIPACAHSLGNSKAQRDLLRVSIGLAEGNSFWETLAQVKFMDSLLIGMVKIGEETGRLPQVMEKCHSYFAQAHQQSLQKMSKLIEPVITLVLGVLLGLVMLAVILPTFALTDII